MKGIIWLWKHRRRWRDLEALWNGKSEILNLVHILDSARLYRNELVPAEREELIESGSRIYEWLQYIGTGKARRLDEWPSRSLGKRPKPLMRGMELPARLPGERSSFLTEDGQLKSGIAQPARGMGDE